MKNVSITQHSLAQDALTHLRDKTTPLASYRLYAKRITELLLADATRNLSVKEKTVRTPLGPTKGQVDNEKLVLVTIFRAGLSMLPTALKLFPDSPVGFAGLRRDEKTAIAQEYYWNMPKMTQETSVLLLDPMLATAGSALHVLRKLQQGESKQIRLVCIIAAPEGIQAIEQEFPNVQIYTAAVDEKLNAQKFIVPGLGDFGDRYFGTVWNAVRK